MSIYDARFSHGLLTPPEESGAGQGLPASRSALARIVLLACSGAVAGLLYPSAFAWLFGVTLGTGSLLAFGSAGTTVGLVMAAILSPQQPASGGVRCDRAALLDQSIPPRSRRT